jgi:hypothetical protein
MNLNACFKSYLTKCILQKIVFFQKVRVCKGLTGKQQRNRKTIEKPRGQRGQRLGQDRKSSKSRIGTMKQRVFG